MWPVGISFARLAAFPRDPNWPASSPRLSGAASTLLSRVAAAARTRAPIVLALEDLHWADPSSLALTASFCGCRRRAARFYLVGRPESTPLLDELTQDLPSTRSARTPGRARCTPADHSMLGAPAPWSWLPSWPRGRPGTRSSSRSWYGRSTSGVLLAEHGVGDPPGWDARSCRRRSRACSQRVSTCFRERCRAARNRFGGRTTGPAPVAARGRGRPADSTSRSRSS